MKKGEKMSDEQKRKLSISHTGKKLSEEHKRKLSDSHKGKQTWMKGRVHTKETKEKMSLALSGKKYTEERRIKHQKYWDSMRGKAPYKMTEEIKDKIKKARKLQIISSQEEHWNWKGDNASYSSIHKWINKYKKKPLLCEHCGKEKKLDWANIDHKYKRNLNDWIALCRKCHIKYDGELF